MFGKRETLPGIVREEIRGAARRGTTMGDSPSGYAAAGGATLPALPNVEADALDAHESDPAAHAGLLEPALGAPPVDGYVLESDADGTRRWAPLPTGGGLFELDAGGDLTPALTAATDALYELDGNGDVMPA